MYKLPKTVKQACRLLNKIKPGWYKKVKISELDIESPWSCILHYVFYPTKDSGWCDTMMKLFGHFGCEAEVFSSNKYLEEWKTEIRKLRKENK